MSKTGGVNGSSLSDSHSCVTNKTEEKENEKEDEKMKDNGRDRDRDRMKERERNKEVKGNKSSKTSTHACAADGITSSMREYPYLM